MALKLQITFDDASGLVVRATGEATAGNGPAARVSVALTTDEVPSPKRREGESDEKYAARCASVLPDAVQVPAEYFEGLAELCAARLDGVRELLEHHAGRAALEHALLVEGKASPGVKQLKVGGKLSGGGKGDAKKV